MAMTDILTSLTVWYGFTMGEFRRPRSVPRRGIILSWYVPKMRRLGEVVNGNCESPVRDRNKGPGYKSD